MKLQFLVLLASLTTFSQTLVPDPTFGNSGIGRVIFPSGYSQPTSMQIQTDGKILVCGHTTSNSGHQVGITRFNQDGSLDENFGTDGIVILDKDVIPSDRSYVRIVNDDKIMVVSTSRQTISSYDRFLVAQYNNDGTLDSEFGDNGITLIDGTGYLYGFEVQSDGKLILIGEFYSSGQSDFGIVRLDATGSLDTTFGLDGRTVINFGTIANPTILTTDFPTYCQILNDGKILIGGSTNSTTYQGYEFALAKLDQDGKLDITFGNEGKLITSFGINNAQLNTVMVNDNDEIFALGAIYGVIDAGAKIGLAKYDQYGNLDVNFGTNGTTITQINMSGTWGFLNQAYITEEGKILGAGFNQVNGFNEVDVVLMQYNPDGTLDDSFGIDGLQIFDFDQDPTFESMTTIVSTTDNKVIMAGILNNNFAVVKLIDGALSTSINVQTNFSVFPNPTKDVLNITNIQKMDAITILDVLGKSIFEKIESTSQIDVSRLQQGLYFIQILSQGKTFTQKFIKE